MTDYLNSPNLSEDNKKALENNSDSNKLQQSGIGDSVKREAYPLRLNTVAEKPWVGLNNSHIVLGKDRKSEAWTGYGGKGYPESGMIHLVAGHFGAGLKDYKEDPRNPVRANPNFMLDSAYVYISQTSDIDDYLELKPGTIGNSVKKSAIAIKADDVRIIGERGIKLVTRRFSEDSKRSKIAQLKGIDLIAGNDDKDLQPMLKGNNTIQSLDEMTSLLEQTLECLMEILFYQSAANASIANHEHMTAVPGKTTLPISAELKVNTLKANYVFDEVSNKKLDSIRKNLTIFKQNYLNKSGEDYIASRYNNTN